MSFMYILLIWFLLIVFLAMMAEVADMNFSLGALIGFGVGFLIAFVWSIWEICEFLKLPSIIRLAVFIILLYLVFNLSLNKSD